MEATTQDDNRCSHPDCTVRGRFYLGSAKAHRRYCFEHALQARQEAVDSFVANNLQIRVADAASDEELQGLQEEMEHYGGNYYIDRNPVP